eukprot:CAMPEP_0174276972 /NCGR_PEP_ID=MMETSP0439-20130205/60677_1 /TAXON_ID=0 /ORGANISM="Stereomyxa ramosa, Strain Chinc5" /LENGTH=303 /DNA_ID=CAMNT_0015369249 /DNA_START=520 /DNA_END=1431 /DNA_ORIENTATION=+
MYRQVFNNLQQLRGKDFGSKFFALLVDQCCHLIGTRSDLVLCYNALAGLCTQPNILPVFEELLLSVSRLLEPAQQRLGQHPLLEKIQLNLVCEIKVLQQLLFAQKGLNTYQYMDTVVATYEASYQLDLWKNRTNILSSHFEKHGSEKNTQDKSGSTDKVGCAVFLWLRKLCRATTAKMVLYFYNIYRDQKFGNRYLDMHSLTSATRPDYVSLVENFAQKTEAKSVCLVYSSSGLPEGVEFSVSGYSLPQGHDYSPPSGLASYPCIFSIPRVFLFGLGCLSVVSTVKVCGIHQVGCWNVWYLVV